MISRWIRATGLLALAPAAALAFETVDLLPYPSRGAFPAWPPDPIGPWTLYAYGGLMHDTNAFRRDTDEQSDMVARIGIGGRSLTRVYGRQRVLLEGFGEYYDYDKFSDIDHFGYGLRGDLLWELGNNMNGAVGYSRRHRHADLGEFEVERREMVTTDRFVVDGGYRFHPSWRLFGAFDTSRSEREFDTQDDLATNTVRVSLTYNTPLANAIGVEARGTRGNARFDEEIAGAAVSNDYEERELSMTLIYVLSAQLRIAGRLGHTERDYDELPVRNFSGTTYGGVVDWLPTTKLVFNFEAYKRPESIIDVDATHVVREGVAAGVSWAPTFKLVFSARFTNEERLNQGDPGTVVAGTPPRDETLRFWRFGVGWEPQRHWQLGVAFDIGERRSNELGRDYDYTQTMFNVRWTY